MILIINICKEKMHYLEFVKPICDILDINNINYYAKDYKKVKKEDLNKCTKVIICGTSLFDNEFIRYYHYFDWLLDFNKPVFGICGGMQIIALVFRGKLKKKTEKNKSFLKKKTEIGFYQENFNKEFFGLVGKNEVYHLHNYYSDSLKLKDFEIFSNNYCVIQAIKHKTKKIYGVLFHPEVRNKEMIKQFVLEP